VKVLLKTVFRIVRYGESKSQFPIMRMTKPPCQVGFYLSPSIFLLPCGCLGFAPYTRSWVRQIHVRIGVRELGPRYGNLSCLDISETLCPSRIWPARQVLFRVFSFQRGVPLSVKASFSEVREIAQSVFFLVS
jgi:hypothetical protein